MSRGFAQPRVVWLHLFAAGVLLVAGAAFADADGGMDAIDPAASRIGFGMKTRWGQTLEGDFPRFQGEVLKLADGRRQVRLKLDARAVEIVGHPAYTRFARGSGFLAVDQWPQVGFRSEPYAPELLRDGGKLSGHLTIRGVERNEVFDIQPASCPQPGRDCDVVATGSVRRDDYGMGRWNFAVSGDVLFTLRIRMRSDPEA